MFGPRRLKLAIFWLAWQKKLCLKSVLRFADLTWTGYLSTNWAEAKLVLTKFVLSLQCFDRLEWGKNVFNCVRPKRAMLWPTLLKMTMFRMIRTKQKSVRLCSAQSCIVRPTRLDLAMLRQTRLKQKRHLMRSTLACYVLTDSIWTGYVWTDSTNAKIR